MNLRLDYVSTPMGMINVFEVVCGIPALGLLLSTHDMSTMRHRWDLLLMTVVAGVFLVTSAFQLLACLVSSSELPYSCFLKLHVALAVSFYVPTSANYMCHESKKEPPYTLGSFAGVLCVVNALLFFSHAVVSHQPISGNV